MQSILHYAAQAQLARCSRCLSLPSPETSCPLSLLSRSSAAAPLPVFFASSPLPFSLKWIPGAAPPPDVHRRRSPTRSPPPRCRSSLSDQPPPPQLRFRSTDKREWQRQQLADHVPSIFFPSLPLSCYLLARRRGRLGFSERLDA